jgi:hypothetical protein
MVLRRSTDGEACWRRTRRDDVSSLMWHGAGEWGSGEVDQHVQATTAPAMNSGEWRQVLQLRQGEGT